MKIPFLCLLVSLCYTPSLACAQETSNSSSAQSDSDKQSDKTIQTDRPGFANSTGIVPRGHIQLESGATAARSGNDRSYSFGQLLVRVPVSKRAEARIGVPSFLVSRSGGTRTTGADNLFLEGKYQFSSSKHATYAILVNEILPTGSPRVTTSKAEPGFNLAADYTFSDALGLTLNLGELRVANVASTGATSHSDDLFGAASLNFTLSPKLGAFSELYAIGGDGPTQKYLDGGFTYLLGSRTQLDASAGVGLGNHAGGPDYFYGLGISRLF